MKIYFIEKYSFTVNFKEMESWEEMIDTIVTVRTQSHTVIWNLRTLTKDWRDTSFGVLFSDSDFPFLE